VKQLPSVTVQPQGKVAKLQLRTQTFT